MINKTVMDAVNELKGDLNNSFCYKPLKDNYLYSRYKNTELVSLDSDCYRGQDYNLICSNEEFNQCVQECETNFGKSTSEDYFTWFALIDRKPPTTEEFEASLNEMDKELDFMENKIHWSQAPEGTTHHWESMGSFYKFSKQGRDFVWQNCEWQECSSIDCFEGCLTPKPPQPVFENGQYVFIAQINTHAGIESKRYYLKEHWCNSGHQRQYVELGLLFDNKESAESKCRDLVGLPQLDTRTDKEKAIDEAYRSDLTVKENLAEAYDKWVGE